MSYATSSRLAFDYVSVRSYDRDGRLRVASANLSMAAVNPYLGSEIPDSDRLGLDPDRIYRIHRPADELAQAGPSFCGVPLLRRHVPVDVDDHKPADVVGSIGSDVRFDAPYLTGSLIVWSADAIRGITSGACQELSAAYRYTPVMRPGQTPDGVAFDGVMKSIQANHVALVAAGRAGPDCVVGDGQIETPGVRRFYELFPDAAKIRIL